MHVFNLPCLTTYKSLLSCKNSPLCVQWYQSQTAFKRASTNFEEGKILNDYLALGLVKATKPPVFGFRGDVGKDISPMVTGSLSDPH